MYFLLPSCSVILKHVFQNSRYFWCSKLLLNALPSSGDKPCWGPDAGEHLVQQVSPFFVSTLSPHTEWLSHASAVCLRLLRTWGATLFHGWRFAQFCSTQHPHQQPSCGGWFHHVWTTASQRLCKQFAVFGIWNLKYRSFLRLLLQIYIHSCLRESKILISSEIKCQESVIRRQKIVPLCR